VDQQALLVLRALLVQLVLLALQAALLAQPVLQEQQEPLALRVQLGCLLLTTIKS
jgi:hypothetical protein